MSNPKVKTPQMRQADREVYLAQRAYQHSALTARAQIAQRMNTQFGGKRDMAEALGYPNNPGYEDLYSLYDRDGMAARVVDCVSDETWRKAPVLTDGGFASDKPEDLNADPFLRDFDELAKKLDLFGFFSDVDAVCGYSRYAIMFLGLPGEFSQPAKRGPLSYVSVFDESQAAVTEKDSDTASPRYGQPTLYTIQFEGVTKQVHWSRVIHVREGRGRSPIYGTPRLKKLLDRLYDLTKVVGGGSEAFWLAVFRGIAFLAREGAKLPREGTPEFDLMQDDIDEYMHGMARYLQLSGVDVQDLGSTAVDGNGQFQVIIACIAGISGIPKRILIGSEMGQLASSQDDKNFADTIAGRQTRFAEIRILRPFLDRCISLKIISAPKEPRYGVTWLSLFELNPLEKSTEAVNVSTAISTMTGGVPDDGMLVADFTQRYLNYVLPEAPDAQNAPTEFTDSPDQPGADEPPTQSQDPAPSVA